MKLPLQGRTIRLLAVVVPLLLLFAWVALSTGPLAPVEVTVVTVETRSIAPKLFGVGTVEARYTYKIGPTFAARVKQLNVDVGERVVAGQSLGEMDPVDLDDKVRSQDAAQSHAQAALRQVEARQTYAQVQAKRYDQLFAAHAVSEEAAVTKRQELDVANADLAAARNDVERTRAEFRGVVAQRGSLQLIAPHDGIVSARDVEPGTTIVPGQAVVELIDTANLWINVRFDQISAQGLAARLPASVVLRSHGGQVLTGHILRLEPRADAVTEEVLAKVTFEQPPSPLPAVGELAEITVALPASTIAPVVPNAAIQRMDGVVGVWRIVDGNLRFTPLKLGATDLDGQVQVSQGLKAGDQVIAFSAKALTPRSRIHVVDRIPGVAP